MSASYPSAVKVFAARSNGQTIDSAHVGDLQDEVSAIEDGILNGTAPLTSSNARVNSLQVAGGSSFVGNSTFAGSVAISSNLTVSGAFFPVRVGCLLTHSASQNVPSGTLTGLSFDTESFDSGLHSTAANSSRLNLASSGTWLIGGNLSWLPVSTGGSYRGVRIQLNDASALALVYQSQQISVSGGVGVWQSITAIYKATSTTDYVTLLVQQDSPSTMSIPAGSAAPANLSFWATLVGA